MDTIKKILSKFVDFIGKIEWPSSNFITIDEQEKIKEMLKPNYYIILTRRSNHLSTFFISLAHFFLRLKFGHYAHVLMNLEDEVNTSEDFRLIEALGTGVQYSTFDKVFDVHSVALLKPKSMSVERWTAVLDAANNQLGKPYDTLFDLTTDTNVSCVEMVRNALMADPDYYVNFAEFERMINKTKNLTPQMFYECKDFEVVYEIRRRPNVG